MADRPSDNPRQLVSRMAGATGHDLIKAQRLGDLSIDAVSDMIQTCGKCQKWRDCPSWIDAQEAPAPRAPGYCLNRLGFDNMT